MQDITSKVFIMVSPCSMDEDPPEVVQVISFSNDKKSVYVRDIPTIDKRHQIGDSNMSMVEGRSKIDIDSIKSINELRKEQCNRILFVRDNDTLTTMENDGEEYRRVHNLKEVYYWSYVVF